MEVAFHPEAEEEFGRLPPNEKVAMDHALEKLEALGARLPYPHSSAVQGADRLRELRPRSGRSPWRALYRQVKDVMVIGAIGPEASSNRRGFATAIRRAESRLAELDES